MKTSTNQINIIDNSVSGIETVSSPEKETFLKIYVLNDGEVDLRGEVLSISQYSIHFTTYMPLDDEDIKDKQIKCNLYTHTFNHNQEISGTLQWEKRKGSIYEYRIQIDHALNTEFLLPILDTAHILSTELSGMQKKAIPSPHTLELCYILKHQLQKTRKAVSRLEQNNGIFGYEMSPGVEDNIVNMCFLELRPLFEFTVKKTFTLFEGLPEQERVFNFHYLIEELKDHLFADPFYKRAVEKPLNYAGDFEMMRAIYRQKNEGESLFGKVLHKFFIQTKSALAVKNRQVFLQGIIKERLTQRPEKFTVLSIASGPAQEIVTLIENTSQQYLDNLTVYLLDQDPRAMHEAYHSIRVALIEQNKSMKIHTLPIELGRFIKNHRQWIGTPIDLIYSSGLFDYVKQKTARTLCKMLFRLLNRNGEMFIGNFTDKSPEKGLLALLDWYLIYRSDAELLDFASLIDDPYDAEVVQAENPQCYLHLTKK